MKKLESFLIPLLKKHIGSKKYNELRIIHNWAQIVGEDLAGKCLPQRVENGILFIYSESSMLNSQLLMMRRGIIKEINKFLAQNFVKDIFLVQGKIEKPVNMENSIAANITLTKKKQDQIIINSEEKAQIENLVSTVQDLELKEKLEKLLLVDVKFKKHLKLQGYYGCKTCGQLINQAEFCHNCLQVQEQEKIKNLLVVFQEVPYINYQECQKYIKCDTILFDSIKEKLKKQLQIKLEKQVNNRKELLTYVMLCTGIAPDKLTEQIIADTLMEIVHVNKK